MSNDPAKANSGLVDEFLQWQQRSVEVATSEELNALLQQMEFMIGKVADAIKIRSNPTDRMDLIDILRKISNCSTTAITSVRHLTVDMRIRVVSGELSGMRTLI